MPQREDPQPRTSRTRRKRRRSSVDHHAGSQEDFKDKRDGARDERGRGDGYSRGGSRAKENGAAPSDDGRPAPRVISADMIPPRKLNRDAKRVIMRLQSHNYEAYFVGGCVRDLWIGCNPKDYDIATDATPHEIRRLFRNGRIIGRRFKLVHIYYGDHIIETSTFRGDPARDGITDGLEDEDDLLILEDNVFGTAAEDAQRRDFTVNGLFLDPSNHTIIDYVDGIRDLDDQVLRAIGNPRVRMAEDPVRILRAVKFATRLGFRIADETWDAMCEQSPNLTRSAPPRVLEEILRLLRSGSAQGALKMLYACGALAAVLPDINTFLGPRDSREPDLIARKARFWRLLEALDSLINFGTSVPDTALCVSVLYLHLVEAQADPETRTLPHNPPDLGEVCKEVIEAVTMPARLSRRDSARARRIIVDQALFTLPASQNFNPMLFARSAEFPLALQLFGLRMDSRGQGMQLYEGWQARREEALSLPGEEVDQLRKQSKGRRRRRRRRRTRGSGGE